MAAQQLQKDPFLVFAFGFAKNKKEKRFLHLYYDKRAK